MQNSAIKFLAFGVGVLLLFHGVDKIMNGIGFIEKMLMAKGIPYSHYVAYGVYLGEVVAPLALILGKCIRFAGLIIAFNMLVAIVLVHQNDILSLGAHGSWAIELPMFYLIAGIALALGGDAKKKSPKDLEFIEG